MAVHKTFNDTEENSLRSVATLGCNRYSQITVAHVLLPKAVLSTVKIFAVYLISNRIEITIRFLINILDQISVLVGNFVTINKHTGPNKHTGATLLAQKYNFL